MAERVGVEPTQPLQAVQISNLLHYRPAHAPQNLFYYNSTVYLFGQPINAIYE